MRLIKSKGLDRRLGERIFVGEDQRDIMGLITRRDSSSSFGILSKDDLGFYIQVCELTPWPLTLVTGKIERVNDESVVGIMYEKAPLTFYHVKL